MKFLDGVTLDETELHQVRSHNVIFLGIIVLAALTQADDEVLLLPQTMSFGSGNELGDILEESWGQPRGHVHPFPIHRHDRLQPTLQIKRQRIEK
jgi:hypothetical protein